VLQAGGGRVSLVDDTSWSEDTVTWSTAPAAGAVLVEMPQSSRDGTIAANVTATLNADADAVVAFALTTPAASLGSYHSKEAGHAPRLVLSVRTFCAGSPDSDGDRHSDGCDCLPTDPTVFAVPAEIRNLRFINEGTLAWDSAAASSGSATRYDVMAGDLADVGLLGTSPADVCLADQLADTQVVDPTPPPANGEGLFFLVRGDNACGKGRYETASTGADRATTVCP
jgi:hypothetical protein